MKLQKDLVLYVVSGLEVTDDKVCSRNKNAEVINGKFRIFLLSDLNLTERWICLNHLTAPLLLPQQRFVSSG